MVNELALQAEKKKAYMNEYQVMLHDFMHSMPIQDELKDQLHKCILATKMNDIRDFVNGTLTITSTLRAVFVGAFNKVVERSSMKVTNSSSIEETADRERPVLFIIG